MWLHIITWCNMFFEDTIGWKINNLSEKFLWCLIFGVAFHPWNSWLQYSTMYQCLVLLLLERARYSWPCTTVAIMSIHTSSCQSDIIYLGKCPLEMYDVFVISKAHFQWLLSWLLHKWRGRPTWAQVFFKLKLVTDKLPLHFWGIVATYRKGDLRCSNMLLSPSY